MGLLPVLLVHAWFWLVAFVSIQFQRAPVVTVVCVVAAIGFYYAGYCSGWSDRKTAERYED
jgi:hypothetical protein